jgi:hypothetical protein
MSTPGTIVELVPPTDAHTGHRGRIVRQDIERLHAKAAERRDDALAKTARPAPLAAQRWPSKNLNFPLPNRLIFVRPADPQRVVLDLAGQPYPTAGAHLPASDAYVHRRLRDGSLVRVTPPDTGA